MSSNIHPFYSHSGKFGVHGPLLAVIAGVVAGYPLGIVYSYLIKWIPFIYLNCLITVGYGFAFGLLTHVILKFAKVRNRSVALLTGLVVGLIALYGSWNGCAKALAGDKVPALLMPDQMVRFMKILNENGSWGIGFSSSSPVTGILLALFWLAEAVTIVGLTTFISYNMTAETPFCETHECWLDKEKKIDKLDAFVQPEHLAAFQAGDISPLDKAQPRVPASGRFARLSLKHSDQCHDFCTLSISNVTITIDRKGNPKENAVVILRQLQVPKSMLENLQRLDPISATAPATV